MKNAEESFHNDYPQPNDMKGSGEFSKVIRKIETGGDGHVAELRKICKQPSISAQKKGIKECVNLLESMMKELGIKVKVMETSDGSPILLGELNPGRKGQKTILFYNHYDVQPPEPLEEWTSDPFGAEVREGKIYARGVADNKGNLVARLIAIKSLVDVFGELPINVKFLVEGEEEVGSPHLREFVKANTSLLSADACLWEGGQRDLKGRPEIYLGCKGIMYVELRSRTASVDQHSMYAPVIPNAAWRLAWALGTLKGRDEKILVKGHYEKVRKPSKEDLELLRKIPFEEEEYRRLFGVKDFLAGPAAFDFYKTLIFSPTCTVCGIQSGYTGKGMKTVNPSYAFAKVDFRLVPDQEPEEVFEKVRRHIKDKGFHDIDVVMLDSLPPARASPKSEIAKAAIETCSTAYGMEPAVIPMMYGSGPMAYFTKSLNLPVVSGECLGRPDSRIHAPNENLMISDYLDAIKHSAAMMMEFGAR